MKFRYSQGMATSSTAGQAESNDSGGEPSVRGLQRTSNRESGRQATTYVITYTYDGGTYGGTYPTLEAAEAAVRLQLPFAAIGHERDILDGGPHTLFWIDPISRMQGKYTAGVIRKVRTG